MFQDELAVEVAGFRAAVLVSGHYGGVEVDMKFVAQVYSANRPLRTAAMADSEIMHFKDYPGDHAGKCETSQLWALRAELVDLSRMPAEPIDGVLFASGEWAAAASRRDGEGILASQIETLQKLSDLVLTEAETLQPKGWFGFEEADAIWQQILAHKAQWVSSQPPETYWDYLAKRQKMFTLPKID